MTDTDFRAAETGAGGSDDAATDPVEPGAGDDNGGRSWRNLLSLDSDLYQQKKIRILTPEARVLIHLKLHGSMSVTEAMKLAGVSYRGFYAVLERLKQAGLVGQVKDKQDQRVRQLRLDSSMPIPPDNL